jgi:hypothetical protein
MALKPSTPNCWAAPLGVCHQKITREHTVSECLFPCDLIMVQGFPWCLSEPKQIGLSSLVAKILCKRHNSELSPLDSAALDAFNVFRKVIDLNDVRGKVKRPSLWNVKTLQIDGPRLERWFLKTLINLTFGTELTIGPWSGPPGKPPKELVEIAFGLRQFEQGAGLYLASRAGEQIDSMDRVGCTTMTQGTSIVAARFNFRGYPFFLNLTSQKFELLGDSHLLHRDATMKCSVQGRLSHVVKIKGWS